MISRGTFLEDEYCMKDHRCHYKPFYTMCPTIDGLPPKQHIECQHPNHLQNKQYFHCVDRSDVGHAMFERLVFRDTYDSKLPLLSEKLMYNQSGIICSMNTFITWTFEDLFNFESTNEVHLQLRQTLQIPYNKKFINVKYCYLKDNSKIERSILIRLLLSDLSFKGRHLIPPDWLDLNHKVNGLYQLRKLIRSASFTICDGILETLNGYKNGSDEDLEKCTLKYPPSATVVCEKPGIYNNLTIKIRAVPCNGVVECKNREDERHCNLDYKEEVFLSLAIGFVVAFGGSGLYVWSLDLNIIDPKEQSQQEKKQSDNDSENEENTIKNQVLVQQIERKRRKILNKTYFKRVQRRTLGHNYAKALNTVKHQFGPSTAQTIISDSKEEAKTKLSWYKKVTKKINSWKEKLSAKIPVRVSGTYGMGRRLFSHYRDLVKDVVFLVIIGQLVKDGEMFLQWVSKN